MDGPAVLSFMVPFSEPAGKERLHCPATASHPRDCKLPWACSMAPLCPVENSAWIKKSCGHGSRPLHCLLSKGSVINLLTNPGTNRSGNRNAQPLVPTRRDPRTPQTCRLILSDHQSTGVYSLRAGKPRQSFADAVSGVH